MSPLRTALVTPLTGPLGGYGRAGAAALRLWAELDGARLTVHDAHPDPGAAVRAAGRPDVLFGPYGSGPARSVAAATDRLVWNHGGARAEAPHLLPVLAPARSYLCGMLELVAAARLRPEAVLLRHGDTGFGNAVADGAQAAAVARGWDVDRAALGTPIPASPGRVLLVAGDFAGERAVAAALPPGRLLAAGFVGAGTEEVLAGLPREGLFGPAQWLLATAPARPELGPRGPAFVAAYARATGDEPGYPAVQAFAAGLLATRCVQDAGGAGDAAVLGAARALDTSTVFGAFRLDEGGRQVGHRVLTVQWRDGVRRVVHPPSCAHSAPRWCADDPPGRADRPRPGDPRSPTPARRLR